MAATLQYQELEDFSRRNEELGRRAYMLNVDGEPFGLLYVSPEAYTFSWHGSIDFSKIETEAVASLSQLLSSEGRPLDLENYRTKEATAVSFITSDDSDELSEYRLAKGRDYYQYKKALRNCDRIAFARYDIDYRRSVPGLKYSFTAENPHFQSSEGELALKLPKSQTFSKYLLQWILAHHSLGSHFQNTIDWEDFTQKLSGLASSSPGISVRTGCPR